MMTGRIQRQAIVVCYMAIENLLYDIGRDGFLRGKSLTFLLT